MIAAEKNPGIIDSASVFMMTLSRSMGKDSVIDGSINANNIPLKEAQEKVLCEGIHKGQRPMRKARRRITAAKKQPYAESAFVLMKPFLSVSPCKSPFRETAGLCFGNCDALSALHDEWSW